MISSRLPGSWIDQGEIQVFLHKRAEADAFSGCFFIVIPGIGAKPNGVRML